MCEPWSMYTLVSINILICIVTYEYLFFSLTVTRTLLLCFLSMFHVTKQSLWLLYNIVRLDNQCRLIEQWIKFQSIPFRFLKKNILREIYYIFVKNTPYRNGSSALVCEPILDFCWDSESLDTYQSVEYYKVVP